MSYPTLDQIASRCREIAADDDPDSPGQLYSTSLLRPHINAAVRKASQLLSQVDAEVVSRTLYKVVPQGYTRVHTKFMGSDIREPKELWYRIPTAVLTISNAVQSLNPDYLTITTSTDHGFVSGDTGTIDGIQGLNGTNGRWPLTVTSSTVVRANGLRSITDAILGGYEADTGTIVRGPEAFTELNRSREESGSPIRNYPQAWLSPTQNFGTWSWRDNYFEFGITEQQVEFKLVYISTNPALVAPEDEVLIIDSLEFLAHYALAQASAFRNQSLSQFCMIQAMGGTGEGGGGFAYSMRHAHVRQMQDRLDTELIRPGVPSIKSRVGRIV